MNINPIIKLPKRHGFAQRHYTFRERTPFLKALDTDIQYRRSGVTKQAILNDILKFQTTKISYDSLINTQNFQLAIALTREAFRLGAKVPMLHLNDVFDYDLPIWSSSPGLPYKSRGYLNKRSVVAEPHNRKMIRWFWHGVKHNKKMVASDCCAFVRSHLTKDVDKVRAVWGYPIAMTLGEAVFAVPLIEAFKHGEVPMAYGYETAVGGMKRLVCDTAAYTHFSAIDFKDFDKTVQPEIINLAFDILMQNIDFVNYRDYGTADAVRNMRMWFYIKDYFINTPIRMCDGSRYQKTSGVASGSYFTQLVDSVVNYLLITWIYLEQVGSPPEYLKVLGDDSIAGHTCPIDLDHAEELMRKVGMRLNVQKSGVSRNINNLKFLGFQINCGWPLKSFDEWMALLHLPEHFDKTWDDVATRALGLLHANCGMDEKFDFVAREIVNIRPFEIQMTKGMAKFLSILGIDYIDKEPPTPWQFMRRLQLP